MKENILKEEENISEIKKREIRVPRKKREVFLNFDSNFLI